MALSSHGHAAPWFVALLSGSTGFRPSLCPSAPLRHHGHMLSSKIHTAALPVWAVSARLIPPREFVVRLVLRRSQVPLAWPLLGLVASSWSLPCSSVHPPPYLRERAFVVLHPRPKTRSSDPPSSSAHPFSLLVPASDGNWSWQTKFLTVTSWASVLVPPPPRPRLEPSACVGYPFRPRAVSAVRLFAMSVLT